jgi:hypothetical protein
MFKGKRFQVVILAAGALLGCLVLLSNGLAQQPKPDVPAPGETQAFTTKATKVQTARSVNFRKDLDLPLDSLTTLGSRIESARRKPDPVALAHAASELAAAEKVSGKTASLTSKQVLKESVEMAAMRKKAAELKITLHVANQLLAEKELIATLNQNIADVAERTKADQDAINSKLEPTSAPRTIVVNNYTTQYLDIYVNGYMKTSIDPGSSQTVTVDQRWNPVVLKAYGNEDDRTWGPKNIQGRFNKYTWNIDDAWDTNP